MPCSRATSRIRLMVGPSSGSAVSYHFGSCSAQKYGPWKISWRPTTWAPWPAASAIILMCLSIASCLGMLACAWISAARTVRIVLLLDCVSPAGGGPLPMLPRGPAPEPPAPRLAEGRDDLLAEPADQRSRIVDHRVN